MAQRQDRNRRSEDRESEYQPLRQPQAREEAHFPYGAGSNASRHDPGLDYGEGHHRPLWPQRSEYRGSGNPTMGGYSHVGGSHFQEPKTYDQRDQNPDSPGASHDEEYHHWRKEQIEAFDRDYASWRKERRSSFADDFNKWREGKKAPPGDSRK